MFTRMERLTGDNGPFLALAGRASVSFAQKRISLSDPDGGLPNRPGRGNECRDLIQAFRRGDEGAVAPRSCVPAETGGGY